MQDRAKIGEILVRRAGLTPDAVERVLHGQARTLMPFASTALELGLVTESQAVDALAHQLGVPGVQLESSTLSLEWLGAVPREVAIAHRILPLGVSGGRMRLAMAQPGNRAVLDEVSFASGHGALPYVAVRRRLDQAIESAYAARARGETVLRGPNAKRDVEHVEFIAAAPRVSIETNLPAESSDPGLDGFPDAPPPQPRASHDKPRVLAVDDEVEILDIITKALSHKGMEVVQATRGRQAQEMLRASDPDVVLLDAMLPEIHGFELCQQIKRSERYRHTPVMMISAIYTGWNFIQDVKRNYGADDYMTKPFRVMELVHKVEELLAKAEGSGGRTNGSAAKEVSAHVRAAMDHLAQGRVNEAYEKASEAVRTDPFDARSYFIFGSTLHRMGRVFEAISAYERVVELAPNQFNALKSLATLYERQGFKAKAVEMWTRALEQSPSDAVRKAIKAHLIDLL